MVFGRSKKKVNESSSTLSSYSEPRASLPLSQQSDLSVLSDEKIVNPGGQPLSPPAEKRSSRVQVKQVDDSYASPPLSQVNVHVHTSTSPSPRQTTRPATYSTYQPRETNQQPVPYHCGRACTRKITRTSNRNNNGGRPYYVCAESRCNKFVTWDDDIGQGEENPLCDCGKTSRRLITNRDKGRKFFYKCVNGECDFFEWHLDEEGVQVSVSEDVADALRKLRVA